MKKVLILRKNVDNKSVGMPEGYMQMSQGNYSKRSFELSPSNDKEIEPINSVFDENNPTDNLRQQDNNLTEEEKNEKLEK